MLIADDDPAVRSLFTTALEREGFDTVLAANGREAIERIRRQELQAVRELGIQLGHGYLLGRPAPVADAGPR